MEIRKGTALWKVCGSNCWLAALAQFRSPEVWSPESEVRASRSNFAATARLDRPVAGGEIGPRDHELERMMRRVLFERLAVLVEPDREAEGLTGVHAELGERDADLDNGPSRSRGGMPGA